jgi:hypothetical protein
VCFTKGYSRVKGIPHRNKETVFAVIRVWYHDPKIKETVEILVD